MARESLQPEAKATDSPSGGGPTQNSNPSAGIAHKSRRICERSELEHFRSRHQLDNPLNEPAGLAAIDDAVVKTDRYLGKRLRKKLLGVFVPYRSFFTSA